MASKIYKNLNLPATLIHTIDGKKYQLNGTLLEVNEITEKATMQFGDKVTNSVPLNEVFLVQESLKDLAKKGSEKLKSFASKLWNKIKDVVKSIGGLLIPVNEDGDELVQFVNNPLNLPLFNLPECVRVVPTAASVAICEEKGAKVRNNSTLDEAFRELERKDRDGIETYWKRVMREYIKPENESLTLSDTVKMVNEKYYKPVLTDNTLNEVVSLHSPKGLYGEEVNTKTLVGEIVSNIAHQLRPIKASKFRGTNKGNYVKPLLIWGAPGIGKTAIIKQAARFMFERYDKNLDLVTVACGGLKPDDFELPDTVKNYVDQKIAISTPKSWLPVYDKGSLTEEKLREVDAFYNSGKYRIRQRFTDKAGEGFEERYNEKGEKVVDLSPINEGETFDGGILFFDELARIDNPQTMTIMMNLFGDRQFHDMELASQWATIAAANRMSDDNRSEADANFRALWDDAKKSRFTHLTYVPTKEEWLTWAREVDEDGYQNVDELICKFIERSDDGVWYDALENGTKKLEGPDATVAGLQQIIDKWKKGIELTAKELKTLGTYISNPGSSTANMSLSVWNGRSWHQKINKEMMSILYNEIFYDYPEKFEECFSETTRVRSTKGGYSSEEYTAKNLDMSKLKKQLNSLSEEEWYEITGNIYGKINPSEDLRKNDRLAFFLAWVGWIIRKQAGGNDYVNNAWDRYRSIDSIIEPADIRSIYETGHLRNKTAAKEDDILFDTAAEYSKINSVAWKSNPRMVDEVISMVLDAFDKYILPEEIKNDFVEIKKNLSRYEVTDQEIQHFKNKYSLKLTDQRQRVIKEVPLFLGPVSVYTDDQPKRWVHILKNSKTAEKMANVALWISKISEQIGSNTPVAAAYGVNGRLVGTGTIARRYTNIISANPELLQTYKEDNSAEQYDLTKPASNILYVAYKPGND